MIGKRKRETVVSRRQQDSEESEIHGSGSRDIFRQYFESAFEPLPGSTTATPSLLEEESQNEPSTQSDSSTWEGLSDEEDTNTSAVQIVEHQSIVPNVDLAGLRSSTYKSFMTSKPPQELRETRSTTERKGLEEEDESETLNLKLDLDLQRLLKESHLLEEAKTSSKTGIHRHKATDMRLQALGSKTSILKQERMPLSHRQGISTKAKARETWRRKDAQENGVVLEKVSKSTRMATVKRDRGVDVPAVGRFRGGTLTLNRKDVVSIQGSHRNNNGQKKGRR